MKKFVQSKKAINVLVASMLLGLIWSCQETLTTPLQENEANAGLSYDKLILNTSKSSAKVNAAVAPTITKVTTKVACDNCVSLTSVLIPWVGQQNYMEFNGANFGSTVGQSIAITDGNGKTQTSYSFGFLSWSDNTIRLQTGATLTASPMALRFVITTADGRVVTTTQNVTSVISQKIWGSELYFVNKKRIDLKLSPLPIGLYPSGFVLDANLVPRVGDVWLFPSITKQSIVVSVSSTKRTISSSKTGGIEDTVYQIGTAEFVNGKEVTMSRELIIRKTTTIYTNAPQSYSYKLITPASSAFSSVIPGQVATKYYR